MSRWTQTWLSGTHEHPEDSAGQDADGRGLHDKAAGTVVLQAR